ncbi:hypothetical protein FHS45_003993 [Thalassobacillus devorans]|nr:hypothetical protein [Thalassobacillus devorans]
MSDNKQNHNNKNNKKQKSDAPKHKTSSSANKQNNYH